MPDNTLDDFLHDFRQDLLARAEANEDFLEAEFVQKIADELVDSGNCEGFEACHYRPPMGGMRVDGYWFDADEGKLDLFISDFGNRESVSSLTQTEVAAIFKRAENFFGASAAKNLASSLEETAPGYQLSRLIAEKRTLISKVTFYLISDRSLSERLTAVPDRQEGPYTLSYHIWDISRLHRQAMSRGEREPLVIDFVELTGSGLPCLPANLSNATYKSYLAVMPAAILAQLYGKYGARLLEQNVRSFLTARGNVNKGIRQTIIQDPEMFFAYNNGITATARNVVTNGRSGATVIVSVTDLQIVNGGQTTASLFHTNRKDKASLDDIFVQMKLSVVDEERSEEVIPKISEYANTQNKVSAADFFANHPFHLRMEQASRRLWAPARQGFQRETHWFYERARGQYSDAQAKLTKSQQDTFLAQSPKNQMFTKTDLAKFENVWDEHPRFVNLGAQKNFAQYASRIGQEWDKHPDRFNDLYFKRVVARAIVFRATEKLVSAQPWYDGGYRANIVAYTIAMLSEVCKSQRKSFDFLRLWNKQEMSRAALNALEIIARVVHDDLMNPGQGVSNISEWAKRGECWERLKRKLDVIIATLPAAFLDELVSEDDAQDAMRSAGKTQRVINGIEAQKQVFAIESWVWADIRTKGIERRIFTQKELDILQIATRIPETVPSEKQCFVLLEALDKARQEAIYND